MRGRVLKSTGSWYEVLTVEKQVVAARVRGKIRLTESQETNPVAVGDDVELEDRQGEWVITDVHERRNHVLRQSVKKKGQAHVLAANIDQALVMATLKQPRTSTGFIDRFLVTAEAYRIPQIVLINKIDLLDADEQTDLNELREIYAPLNIPVLTVSLTEDASIAAVDALLQGKITLIAGHSGVGKSTLLNRLHPNISQATKAISAYNEKGTHSTTYAEMFPVNENTYVIDTPGIKEWGLIDMEPQELSDYFVEMREVRAHCKFGARCLHVNEPGCAVQKAVAEGRISQSRFTNYLRMVSGEDNRR